MARKNNSGPTSGPAAGPFDPEDEFKFKCFVRKGNIRQNPRGGEMVEFTAKISEGLGVAKAKVLSFVQRSLPSAQLISTDLYFKKSKGAPQSQYIVLTEENFLQLTRVRWNLISQRDVTAWENEGKTVLDGFMFEVFMYIHRRQVESAPVGLQQATAGRIEASARQIREYEERNNVRMGPITRQHVTIHQARQPDGSYFTTMPNDNTTRQAQYLDERREEAAQEEEGGGGDGEREVKKIKIEFNGSWVDVGVDIRSLRAALGLPQHDMFRNGIFHEYVHNETVGSDVEDTDHGAQPQQETLPALPPVPQELQEEL